MPNFSGVWDLKDQVQAIAAGRWTGLPLYELYAWGDNARGQLGLGDIITQSSPTQVGTLVNWYNVSSGVQHSGAIKYDNTLWVWGRNNTGQLGQNNTIDRSSPVQVGSLSDWSQIACGPDANHVVKTNGTLWAWGANSDGRLGDGDVYNKSSPIQIGALTTWQSITNNRTSTTIGNAAAIKTDGTLWVWGENALGQLGQNNIISRSSPVQVGALTDWSQAAFGTRNCGAIKTDGTLWTWGENVNGQLGINLAGIAARRSSPVQVGALTDWAQISAGSYYFSAVKTNGTLWAWGRNNQGRLGDNTVIDRSSPIQIGALTTWSSVSIRTAIKTDGTMWAWGGSNVGDNTVVNRSSPVQIGSWTPWQEVSRSLTGALGIGTGTTN